MAAIEVPRLNNTNDVPKIELSKIDNLPYYIEKDHIRIIKEEYNYEEVPIEDFYDKNDELFETVLLKTTDSSKDKINLKTIPKSEVSIKNEVIDDFVRNFLIRLDLKETLNCFQNEWYDNIQKGKIKFEDAGVVPDVYLRNQELNDKVKFLQNEVSRYKTAAEKTKDEYVKMRKERDYHRMHHNRVIQEKNKLVTDLKRLKSHYESYEPLIRTMKAKYDVAIREKVLNQLERDRAVAELTNGKSSEKNSAQKASSEDMAEKRFNFVKRTEKIKEDPASQKHPKDTEFPIDDGVNPYLNIIKEDIHHLSTLRLSHTVQAHGLPLSSLSVHPRKMIAVTTSDDKTWKMWSIPDGQMIMRGEGHTDWISDSDFHPTGKMLATSSGDSTVKIWSFEKEKCIHTFSDHLKAVWSVAWHSCGMFLASASMDCTVKLWDLSSLRCRYTLRGHADSVNSVEFLPFSNTILTSSADKTLSLWDGRTGLVAHTFYGHMNACNQAVVNLKGDTIASCDSDGIIKLWDVRKVAEMESHNVSSTSANTVAFNSSGNFLVIGCDDATIKAYNLSSQQFTKLSGHEDAVHCVQFTNSDNYLLSGGCDNALRIWS